MNKLDTTILPKKEVTLHKHALKYALLRTYASEQRNTWKGGEIFMKHKLVFMSITSIFVLVLLFGYAFLGNNSFTPRAEAKEAVEKAFDRIITLSSEERQQLEQRLKADLESSLTEAKNARDLEVVPEEEIQRITPPTIEGKEVFGIGMRKKTSEGTPSLESEEKGAVTKHFEIVEEDVVQRGEAEPGVRVAFEPGKIPVPHGVKVLRYTDPKGNKVILGINEQDEPVMKMIRMENLEDEHRKVENIQFFNKQ